MTANCLLSVLDMNYVTYSRKHVQYIFFLVAADLFSSQEMSITEYYVYI